MIKIEHTVTASPEQMEFIIEGMRNPMNSWDKSDSRECIDNCDDCDNFSICQSALDKPYFKRFYEGGPIDTNFCVGPNDFNLMTRLAKAGSDDRKFMRQMPVFVRITAPLYWWKEFDTYKVGTVANSCSTMHKIHAKEFTMDDFSCEHLIGFYDGDHKFDENDIPHIHATVDCMYSPVGLLTLELDMLNNCRERYLAALKTENECGIPAKEIWWQLIQLLPSSYNQTRNVTMNYEVLKNMYHARKNHKLDEWHVFCDWVKTLPYSELITEEFNEEE